MKVRHPLGILSRHSVFRTTVDQGGRVVIPKELRLMVGIRPGCEVEVCFDGAGLRIEVPFDGPDLVEEDGRLVIPQVEGVPPLTADEWHEIIDAGRL
jgi:AbrB family looped-hinge helix DNA binding protein